MNDFDLKKYISMRMALRGNLLTSDICGNHCVFCSNKLNPDSVRTVKVGNRKIEDLIEEIDFFPDSINKIHLGETTFNTTEGEFIEYKHFRELVLAIKEKHPNMKIDITTSGNSLTEDVILFFKEHDIDITLSIHSMDPEMRAKLTGNTMKRAMTAINSVHLCKKHGVKISRARLVIMPFVTDDDIKNTIKTLIELDVNNINLWVASFSRFEEGKTVEQLKEECKRYDKIVSEMSDFLEDNFAKIYISPSPADKFGATIRSVRKNSEAYQAGFRSGDVILEVNNEKAVNGSHIEKSIYENDALNAIVKRNGSIKRINCDKNIVNDISVNYILDIDHVLSIHQNILKDRTHTLMICAEASYDVMVDNLARLGLKEGDYYHTFAKNNTFGGSICVGGLLTIDDYIPVIEQFRKEHPEANITKIIITKESFQAGGIDVAKNPLQTLKFESCVDVILI